MADMTDDDILAELGVDLAPKTARARTPREERIIAGFEDIVRFREEHGRAPQHGEGRDIFERLYAVRLDRPSRDRLHIEAGGVREGLSSFTRSFREEEDMITIDGSEGEGGGQVVRNACALSLVTGTPFRIVNVRGGREKPGLMRQHVTAIEAACTIGEGGECEGVAVGAREITFRPGTVGAGEYRFSVGTAGSTGLVLQTVLMPLLLAGGPSRLVLEGGTHNMLAPPFDFIAKAFLPVLRRMGARVEARPVRHGFYPRGGGRIEVDVVPGVLAPIECVERGGLPAPTATA